MSREVEARPDRAADTPGVLEKDVDAAYVTPSGRLPRKQSGHAHRPSVYEDG